MISIPRKTLLSAVICLGLGLFMIFRGLDYGFGSLGDPGSGFFPVIIGTVLLGCGIGTFFVGEKYVYSNELELPLRPLLLIPAALFLFGIVAHFFGILPAIVVCTIVASLSRREIRPPSMIALSVGLAAFVYVVFIVALGIRFEAVKWGF